MWKFQRKFGQHCVQFLVQPDEIFQIDKFLHQHQLQLQLQHQHQLHLHQHSLHLHRL